MKNWRLAYYILMAFWLVAGLGSGFRPFFLLFFSQALLSVAALVMNAWAARSFRFQQTLSASQTIHGLPVHLQLHIYNEKLLPYPLMKVRVATPVFNEQRVLQFSLEAGSQVDFDLILDCPYRGEYRVGMTVIDLIDIFGLVRFPFNMTRLPYYRLPELLVYPLLNRLRHVPFPALEHKAFSRQNAATEDLAEPFSTVRNYRPGDAGKLIHWQVSSRLQTLLTRQFEQSAEPCVLLIVDFQQPPWPGEAASQAQDALCESVAALIEHLLRQNLPVEVSSLGAPGPQHEASIHEASIEGIPDDSRGSGLQDFQRFYRWLAAVSFAKASDSAQDGVHRSILLGKKLAKLANDPSASKPVLVLTTQVDLALVPALVRLKSRSRPAMIIVAGPASDTEAGMGDQLQGVRQAEEFRRQLELLQLPAWFVHYGESLCDLMDQQQASVKAAAPLSRQQDS